MHNFILQPVIIRPLNHQVWEQLKFQYNRNHLFEDTEFPANNNSLFYTKQMSDQIIWRRPPVISYIITF